MNAPRTSYSTKATRRTRALGWGIFLGSGRKVQIACFSWRSIAMLCSHLWRRPIEFWPLLGNDLAQKTNKLMCTWTCPQTRCYRIRFAWLRVRVRVVPKPRIDRVLGPNNTEKAEKILAVWQSTSPLGDTSNPNSSPWHMGALCLTA